MVMKPLIVPIGCPQVAMQPRLAPLMRLAKIACAHTPMNEGRDVVLGLGGMRATARVADGKGGISDGP